MECRSVIVGGIYNINNDSVFKNATESSHGHYYLVLGQYTDSNIGLVQCVCITSMYEKQITTEVPIVFRGRISYIAPYNIFSFPTREFDNVSYSGGLMSSVNDGLVNEFIELIYDINKDCVLYRFMDEDFHKNVEKRYNAYMDSFYKNHKDLREYRFDKHVRNGLVEDVNKHFEKTYYGGRKAIERPSVEIKIVDKSENAKLSNSEKLKKSVPTEPDFSTINDTELISYYNGLMGMTASEFAKRHFIPSFSNKTRKTEMDKKKEKDALNRMFYNNRHRAKNELTKRGLLTKKFPVNVITV